MIFAVLFLFLQIVPVSAAEADFELHFLDVGQGMATLVEADGEYMLLDGGGREASSYVVSYLKQQGIENLRYIIASHYDEDHIAGAIGAMSAIGCQTVLCPDYTTDTEIYSSFVSMLEETGAEVIHPAAGEQYTLGSAVIEVEDPLQDYEEENDRSLCVKVTYGNLSALFCGDASETAESDMVNAGLDLDADIYMASHHGSGTSSSASFLNAVTPSVTVISCASDNAYGHPSQTALSNIQNSGSQLFRTDKQGEVIIYSDDLDYWFSQDPCNDWTPGDSGMSDSDSANMSAGETTDAQAFAETQDNTESCQYICNTNTMKFHYPDCKSVKQMKEENKYYASESRDELIAEGYSPCGNCNP